MDVIDYSKSRILRAIDALSELTIADLLHSASLRNDACSVLASLQELATQRYSAPVVIQAVPPRVFVVGLSADLLVKKIGAIKHLREATGLGLADAKRAIDALIETRTPYELENPTCGFMSLGGLTPVEYLRAHGFEIEERPAP